MAYEGKFDSEELKIQGLLNRYLRLKSSANGLTVENQHLDEDSLTAFVEGILGKRETQPVIAHLVACAFCLHKTAELVKLEMAFAEETSNFATAESYPSKISEVLSGLLSGIFGNNEGAVFAHQEKEEEPDKQKTLEKEN